MTDRDILVTQLIRDEKEMLHPYMDPAGVITIGVGRNLTDMGISHDESMLLLEHDIDAAIHDLNSFPWFAALDPVRQRVLINMRFNLGLPRLLGFQRLLRLLGEQDYQAAGVAMRDSLWFTQTKFRAVRLVQAMQTGVDA